MTQPHLLEVSEVTGETLNISLCRSPCAPSSSGESWVRNPRSGQDNVGCSWGHDTRTGTERPWRCSVTHFPSTGTRRHDAACPALDAGAGVVGVSAGRICSEELPTGTDTTHAIKRTADKMPCMDLRKQRENGEHPEMRLYFSINVSSCVNSKSFFQD